MYHRSIFPPWQVAVMVFLTRSNVVLLCEAYDRHHNKTQPRKGANERNNKTLLTMNGMNGFGMRPGIILLREGTDTSQVSTELRLP